MINLKLNPKDFNDLGVNYNIREVTYHNFPKYMDEIEKCIDYFNGEIKWDGMFTKSDVLERFSCGDTMYLGFNEWGVFGYVWFKRTSKGKWLYNLFVRTEFEVRNYSGTGFVSSIIKQFESDNDIYCEVDEWNEKSIKLFKKLGFQSI